MGRAILCQRLPGRAYGAGFVTWSPSGPLLKIGACAQARAIRRGAAAQAAGHDRTRLEPFADTKGSRRPGAALRNSGDRRPETGSHSAIPQVLPPVGACLCFYSYQEKSLWS